MKPWLFAVAAVLFAWATANAEQWDFDAQIDGANVLVGAGGSDFCSGTVISIKHRLILTADHCVADQVRREEKEFTNPDTGEITKKMVEKKLPMEVSQRVVKDYEIVGSHRYLAVIKGRDKGGDVAFLQVLDDRYVPPVEVKLAPDAAKIRRGQKIWIVGNPGVEFDNSITEGIVSNTERTLEFPGGKLRVFQTDAAAIGGNSGGSVLNDKGEMIGTLSAGLRTSTITFAVPIETTKKMLRSAGFGEVAGWPSTDKKVPGISPAPGKPAGFYGGGMGPALKFKRMEGIYRFFILPSDDLTAAFLGLFP